MISAKRRSGCSEGYDLILGDRAAKAFLVDRLGDYIHIGAQYLTKPLVESKKMAKISESAALDGVIQPHQHIDVRGLTRVATRDRAEQRQRAHPGVAELRRMGTEDGKDFIATHTFSIGEPRPRCHVLALCTGTELCTLP